MKKSARRTKRTTGLPPGTVVTTAEAKPGKPKITVIDYDSTRLEEKQVATVEECAPFNTKPTVTWINIDGIYDAETIEKVGECFDLHPLTLEGIASTTQRPKVEDLESYLFLVLKMLFLDETTAQIRSEQVSLILRSNLVISFQETEGDVFDAIRDRIRNAKGRIRKMGADYLAYSLMDGIVDSYFVILERLGERIEPLEDEVMEEPSPSTLQVIHDLKRAMISLRKSVWPLREVVSGLEKGESKFITKSTRVYLRDVYDHTIQVADTIESLRDTVSGLLDIYLSSLSNRMNQVMKVLTVIATIFIPLTFIAGIYGMNFRHMPELDKDWAYPVLLLLMAGIALSMLSYFKKKKWL